MSKNYDTILIKLNAEPSLRRSGFPALTIIILQNRQSKESKLAINWIDYTPGDEIYLAARYILGSGIYCGICCNQDRWFLKFQFNNKIPQVIKYIDLKELWAIENVSYDRKCRQECQEAVYEVMLQQDLLPARDLALTIQQNLYSNCFWRSDQIYEETRFENDLIDYPKLML